MLEINCLMTVNLQYRRNDVGFERGTFRVKGDNIYIFPVHYNDKAWRLSFFGNELEYISEFDPLTGEKLAKLDQAVIYAKSHFVTPKEVVQNAISQIEEELQRRLEFLKAHDKLVEAKKIKSAYTI